MLVGTEEMMSILSSYGLKFTGALHVGAHECEELAFYIRLGLKPTDVVWIDAMENKVAEATARGIPNVYQAVVTDKDDAPVTFNVTNNVQSSSVLEFGTHATHHPHVVMVEKKTLQTTTLDTFLARRGLDATKMEFWNFDIQGAELLALQGGEKALAHAKAVYLEVNAEEVYKGCATIPQLDAFLGAHGFIRVRTAMTPYGWGDALYIRM